MMAHFPSHESRDRVKVKIAVRGPFNIKIDVQVRGYIGVSWIDFAVFVVQCCS